MPHFTADDRLRSIRRFLIAGLGSPPWIIRIQRAAVADDQRPLALVEATSGATKLGNVLSTTPQGNLDEGQTFSLTLYPSFLDDEDEIITPARAGQRARRTAQLLDDMLTLGLSEEPPGDGPWLWNTPPRRLPLFDYRDVEIDGDLRGATPDEPYAWMTVEDAPVRTIQDPDDDVRWTVACDLRVSWRRGGRVRPGTPITQPLAGGFVPPVP